MKNFIRTISFMIVTVLILSSILPVSIYASSVTTGGENNSAVVGAKTGPDDITMQLANNEPLRGATEEVIDPDTLLPIGNHIVRILIVIDAYNSSYIKDASISFENSNFTIVNSEISDDKNIQSINNEVIKLNSSEIDEKINLSVPVSFKKADYIPEDYFNKTVTIKLSGAYVDRNGEEKAFNKQVQTNIAWFVIGKEFVANTEIVRCFTFTENNQNNVLVTLKLTSGVKNYATPEKEKTLEINAPKIRNIYPEVIVSADNYTSEQDQANEKLTLTKNIVKNANNEYKWETESDVIYLTYVYRNVSDNFYSDKKDINFKTITTTLDSLEHNSTKEAEVKQIPADRNQELSNIILASTTSTPAINRGYIISNTGIETNFDVKYSLNIGYTQITNNIKLKEITNQDSSSFKTKSITVDGNELTRILGENGEITVTLKDSTDTYKINKNNTTITLSSNQEIDEMITSSPTGVGNINFKLVKTIKNNASAALAGKTKISGGVIITNTDLSNNQVATACEWETKIEEPTQKVHFESKFKTLSTIKKNERMILSVVLETDSVDDYLFKNPTLKITYPNVIKTISNVTTNILYDDYNELAVTNTKIDNNNHTLALTISGTQSHYVSSAVSKGILIQIVADYTLDRLAPTVDSAMQLEVHNSNTNTTSTMLKAFKIIAPTEFIIRNKMSVTSPTNDNGPSDKDYFKEERETIEENVEDIVIPLYSNKKNIDVYGTVVNNQGEDVNNIVIVGNFPSKNSNAYSGTQFNGTFDVTITGGIRVDNLNADETYKVYYSRNANEPLNSNNWQEEVLSDAKSYKIVFNGTFKNSERRDFHYVAEIPGDMTYNEHAKETFALLYENGSVSGETYSYVEAKPIGIATKPTADFNVNIEVKDYITNTEIRNGDDVNEGAYLNLKISITNISNRNIRDVKAVVELIQNLNNVQHSNLAIAQDAATETIEEEVGEIKASETKVINKLLSVEPIRKVDDQDNEDRYTKMNVQVYEGNELEFKPVEFENKIIDKKMSVITVCSATGKEINIEDVFQQYFYIRNLTGETMNNVEIKGKLPQGIDYDSKENEKIKKDGMTYSYDSNTREYTIKINEVPAYSYTSRIELNLKAAQYGTYELKTKAKAGNDEADFNTINITVAGKAKNFEVSHTISTPTNEVKDTDTFYFNVTIKNHWDSEKYVMFKDRLNDNFVVKECTILQNDIIKTQNRSINLIDYNFTMKPEDIIEIRIKCGLKTQSKGTTINLTHKPEAKCENVNIVINPITISVTGTGEFVNANDPVINGKYSISGTAWLDANNDGRRDETEQKISNITMKLIDNSTNKVAVDEYGYEQITTTSGNGKYIFTDIPVGSYVVVAYYDADKYGCGDYQNRSVAEDLNNDFIETEYEGTTVGATNNILVQNSNVSAIDISLIPRNTFDMALEKTVTSVSVSSSNGKEASYNFNNELAKVEISNEKGIKYYFVIEYTLTVKNVGYIDGYAKSVIDYIPKGMTFNQEDNPGWYIKADGYAYNNTLTNTLIKAQTQTSVKIKLRKEMTAEQTGIIKNSAELGEVYNTEGIEDINSKEANKDSSENDYSEALVVVALSTGGQIIRVAGIVFGVLGLGAVILSFTKYKKKKTII